MKVLILSQEVWQDGTNGGNVLSNMFSDTNFELAQIYCNPGTPDNNLCKKYYQMTDSMVIHSFLKHKPIGKAFELEENEQKQGTKPEKPNKKFYDFFRNHRLRIFYTAQMLIWNLSNWKNKGLNDFVKDFSPDIIFAPCYGNTFMLRLTRYIAKLTGKKVISYISDDSYTLKQFSLSPFYWINRFAVRRQLRKTFPVYSLVYSNTENNNTEYLSFYSDVSEVERKEAERNAYQQIILEHIGYDYIVDDFNRHMLDEIVGLMVDVVCSEQEFIRIGGDRKPLSVVKSQFLKLDAEHIRFVLHCMKENTSKVVNMRQYLLAVLYNAPLTISNYYSSLVQHDMYEGNI